MDPILTPVERLMLENQVATLDGIAIICALFPNETAAIDSERREAIHLLRSMADDTRGILERCK